MGVHVRGRCILEGDIIGHLEGGRVQSVLPNASARNVKFKGYIRLTSSCHHIKKCQENKTNCSCLYGESVIYVKECWENKTNSSSLNVKSGTLQECQANKTTIPN